ncbi:MAG: 4-hydroxythreonine-4-phosphate dehydrogenase PdxA [Desulfosalsimonadaceae bacterium]
MPEDKNKPIVGITMGDPVGVGPELVCRALAEPEIYSLCRPFVLGDAGVLKAAEKIAACAQEIVEIRDPGSASYGAGRINVCSISRLKADQISWANPTPATGQAMIDYITAGIDQALAGAIDALATGPINKSAMKLAGSRFHGHTELLAHRSGASGCAMMMAGSRLRVVPATIHVPLQQVTQLLHEDLVFSILEIMDHGLKERFGIRRPRIAVAGLNPHAGEGGMFGDEESTIISPAVSRAVKAGLDAAGPLPPDTLFYHAVDGPWDAVLCMYHDQGLIPFKMIHFSDGVNTTLGLPIIRTSVDHGTAYDIAGTGKADAGSFIAAIRMAAFQAENRRAAENVRA